MKFKILFSLTILAGALPVHASWWWPFGEASKVDAEKERYHQLVQAQLASPYDPLVNYNLGVLAYKTGNIPLAQASFERVIDVGEPSSKDLWSRAAVNLGNILAKVSSSTLEGLTWREKKIPKDILDAQISGIDKAIDRYELVDENFDASLGLAGLKQTLQDFKHAVIKRQKELEEEEKQKQQQNKQDQKQQDKNKNQQQNQDKNDSQDSQQNPEKNSDSCDNPQQQPSDQRGKNSRDKNSQRQPEKSHGDDKSSDQEQPQDQQESEDSKRPDEQQQEQKSGEDDQQDEKKNDSPQGSQQQPQQEPQAEPSTPQEEEGEQPEDAGLKDDAAADKQEQSQDTIEENASSQGLGQDEALQDQAKDEQHSQHSQDQAQAEQQKAQGADARTAMEKGAAEQGNKQEAAGAETAQAAEMQESGGENGSEHVEMWHDENANESSSEKVARAMLQKLANHEASLQRQRLAQRARFSGQTKTPGQKNW